MDRRSSSSTTSTRSARARSVSPASARSTSRRARGTTQLTVLVEKEQVALLATEAVAFLDRIADEYPEEPGRAVAAAPERGAGHASPTVPLFRARLIGLGFDPDRELVLLELRERADDDDEDDEPTDADRRRRRRGLRRAHLRDARPGAGDGGARRRGGRRRSPAVPALRHADGPGRAHLPALELTRRPSCVGRAARAASSSSSAACAWSSNATFLVERLGRRRRAAPRSTSRGAASARSGTSPTGTLCHREVAAYELSDALGWDIVPATVLRDGPLGIGTVQRFVDHDPDEHYFTLLDDARRALPRASPRSTCSPTTPTARAGTACTTQANDVIVGHRPRPHVPRRVQAAHRHLGLRGRAPVARGRRRRLPRGRRARTTGPLHERLAPLLDDDELDAVDRRAQVLLARGLPLPGDWHSTPWPLV